MSFEEVKPNENNMSEVTLSDKQPLVTNNLGRLAEPFEFVLLDGYFGEVRKYGGIADSATGRINIDSDRTVRTEQIESTDTFTVGNILYYTPGGSSAAGKLVDTPVAGSIPVGIITEEEGSGGAQTSVTFRPFAQGSESEIGSAVKVKEIVVPTGSHGAGTPVVDTSIPVGSKIIEVSAVATASNASGTATVSDGTNAISSAIVMAVANAKALTASIAQAYRVVTSAGVTITTNGTADAGVVQIYYI